MLADTTETAKEKATRERYHDDRYRAACRARDQLAIELEQAQARIESIQVENDYVVKQIERNRFEYQESLHKLFEKLDPEGCIHSVGKSFDQAIHMMHASVGKLQGLVAQRDVKMREMLEAHAGEMGQLTELNNAQHDKIRTLAGLNATMEEKERLGIRGEQTAMRNENLTL